MITITKQMQAFADEKRADYWRRLRAAVKKDGMIQAKGAHEFFEVAKAIGKSAPNIEEDIALLLELQASPNVDALLDEAQKAYRAFLKDYAAKHAKALDLEKQATTMRQKANEERASLSARVSSARMAAERLQVLLRKMAAAGFPDAVARAIEEERARRIDSIRNEIRVIDLELSGCTQDRFDASPDLRRKQSRRSELAEELRGVGLTTVAAPGVGDAVTPTDYDTEFVDDVDAREQPLGGLKMFGEATR